MTGSRPGKGRIEDETLETAGNGRVVWNEGGFSVCIRAGQVVSDLEMLTKLQDVRVFYLDHREHCGVEKKENIHIS